MQLLMTPGGPTLTETGNTVLPVLDDLGITKIDSSRWQAVAAMVACQRICQRNSA